MLSKARMSVLLLASLCPVAGAQTAPSAAIVTREVARAVNHYSAAIACNVTAVNGSNIAALIPYKGPDDGDKAKFAVLWNGDIGCAGGSGTSSANIAIVTVNPTLSVYTVDPMLSSPVVQFDLPVREFDKLVGNTQNTLIVEARQSAEKDPDCCPSINTRFTLTSDAKGNWRVANQKPAPSHK
jgi:hypothetical protein